MHDGRRRAARSVTGRSATAPAPAATASRRTRSASRARPSSLRPARRARRQDRRRHRQRSDRRDQLSAAEALHRRRGRRRQQPARRRAGDVHGRRKAAAPSTAATNVTVVTDSDGRAAATLTLGMQEGNANNVVAGELPAERRVPRGVSPPRAARRATREHTRSPASCSTTATRRSPASPSARCSPTSCTRTPPSVQTAAVAQTDDKGQFAIPYAPVGFVKLLVDGSTAQLPGAYPSLEYDMVTIAGQNNTVGQPIYLLALNTDNQLCVTGTTRRRHADDSRSAGFLADLRPGPGDVSRRIEDRLRQRHRRARRQGADGARLRSAAALHRDDSAGRRDVQSAGADHAAERRRPRGRAK